MSPATGEAAVLRGTRLRLIAWSGGSTLVMLIVLGIAIYAAAASSLASAGTRQLEERLAQLSPATVVIGGGGSGSSEVGALVVTTDPSRPGVVLGGDLSGTIGIVTTVVSGSGGAPGLGPVAGPGTASGSPGADTASLDVAALPAIDPSLMGEAAAGRTVVVETSMGATPVRVVAGPVGDATSTGSTVSATGGAMVGMVIGTRTTELDTLRTLLVVLLTGGVAVLAAALGFGYLYAGRALVPIRESLRRQREFAADASHELRTPLAITRASIAELHRGRGDPVVVDRALEDLDAGATRLEQLVDDLLLLARSDAGAITMAQADTDLALAAAEATEALEPLAAASGVRLALDIEPAPVRGDEARLRQLVAILLDNAIRHSPAGGRVTVRVGAGARLTVEDEGPGIAPADLEHVFDRFWRAPGAPAGGTGLGLAIALWIAEHHGGSIRAENREDRPGARFVVVVPGG